LAILFALVETNRRFFFFFSFLQWGGSRNKNYSLNEMSAKAMKMGIITVLDQEAQERLGWMVVVVA